MFYKMWRLLKTKFKECSEYLAKMGMKKSFFCAIATISTFAFCLVVAGIFDADYFSNYYKKSSMKEVVSTEISKVTTVATATTLENSKSTMTTSFTTLSTALTSTETITTIAETMQEEISEAIGYSELEDTTYTTVSTNSYESGELYEVDENISQTEMSGEAFSAGIGQYGYNIDPSEYDVLAQIMAHEGGGCEVAVRERIGICFLNRFCNPEFNSFSLWECKNAPYQYFYEYYPYDEETAELAKNLIDVYNSGAEAWEVFCVERYLTCTTVYQRNDYIVSGTNYVYDEIICTSDGFTAHMYYSS